MARTKKVDTKQDTTKTTAQAPEPPEQAEGTTPAPEAPEQAEGTDPATKPPEQAEGTTPAPEAPEQAEGTDLATKPPEQVEGTATAPETQERDIFAGIQNPCVYCGPTVRGVARQYTTYQGGIPDALRDFIKEHPEARQLIVSTARFPAMRRRLDTPGTAEAKCYRRVKEQL